MHAVKPRSRRRYSSDRPIGKFSDDQLGRKSFAERLAGDISTWDGKDSLVIGLYGDWGSGKTSLKNLVLSSLRRRRSKIPTIEFNPWQLSGSGGITHSFFQELEIVLRSAAKTNDVAAAKAKERLDKYSKRFLFSGTIAKLFATLLLATGKTAEAAALLAMAEGLHQASDVSEKGGEALSAEVGEPGDDSLSELKLQLGEALGKIKHPLLVVIDDIDRLTSEEIREIFQLVKANADFPKIVYLLLFDRSIVTQALNSVSDNRGSEFLEKIIQVSYHVPLATPEAVRSILFAGLNEHLAKPGVARRWDKERWTGLLFDGLAPYFRNLRHVYRFLSSFDFHVRQFQADEHFEVNPIDLIALETLRVFEPAVFEQLASAKRILTRDTGPGLFGKIEQTVIDQAIAALLAFASNGHDAHVRHVLAAIFPPISKAYAESTGQHEQKWLKDARVCHPRHFDRYFSFSVEGEELPQSAIDRLADSAGDLGKFTAQLRLLQSRNMLKAALERLDAYKEEIPLTSMPALIQGLCDISDDLPVKEGGLFETEARLTASRIVYFGLRREKDEKRRAEILKKSFEDSTGTLLPVLFTAMQERKPGNGEREQYVVSVEDWDVLKQICVAKLKSIARSGGLTRHAHVSMLLWRWKDWAVEEARAWVQEQVKAVDGALWTLETLMGEVHSHGVKHEVRHYVRLSQIEEFVPAAAIQNTLAGTSLDGATERQRIAVREFFRALKWREEGKPEPDGWDRGWDSEDETRS